MSDPVAPIECPYVGLAPFEAEHADYFFGRTLDSAVLAENVIARPIAVLFGASAVGKSSVINVGLPRALRELGIDARIVARRTWHEAMEVESWLAESTAATDTSSRRPLVLVLDQFEEYFLYATAEQSKDFAAALAALLARKDVEVHLLFSLRDDGLHRLDALRVHLPGLLSNTLELRHLDAEAVREAITGPIAVWNGLHGTPVAIDADFADALIDQLRPRDAEGRPVPNGRIELAYLQLALERIWNSEGGSAATRLRTSTLTERLRGIGEISRQHVEEVLGGLPLADQALCTVVFDRLVTPSGGKILYSVADLAVIAQVEPARIERTLAPLSSGRSRLLRGTDLPGARGGRGYEILHDILARPILQWREQVLANWERQRAQADAAAGLAQARQQAQHEESRRRAAEADRARLMRLKAWLTGLSVLLFVLASIAVWTAVQTNRARLDARNESLRAHGLLLLGEARAMLAGTRGEGDERALLSILAAARVSPMAETRGGLLDALLANSGLLHLLWTGTHNTTAVFSPDDEKVASASDDATIRLWNTRTGLPVGAPLSGHDMAVLALAFTPDGGRLISAGADHTLRVWDAATGRALGEPLKGHSRAVTSLAVSSDGNRIASGGLDGTVRLWDTNTGQALPMCPCVHDQAVRSVAFSRDGARLVAGDDGGAVRQWNVETGQQIGAPIAGHQRAVMSVAYDADGIRIVSGSEDSSVQLWDARTGKPVGPPLAGHRGAVRSVSFSPDGAWIVSAGEDNTLRMWNAATGQPNEFRLLGHKGGVRHVEFDHKGERLVSAAFDGTVRIWRAMADGSLGVRLDGHAGPVAGVAYSPDGHRIASAGDLTVRLWDASTGLPSGPPLTGHTGSVRSVAFSPDGQQIVSASSDGTLRRWHATSGAPLGPPSVGDAGSVWALAYSADGRRIASGGEDGTVHLWDAATGRPQLGPTSGHRGDIRTVAFSPDGKTLASGGVDGEIRLWDSVTGEPIGTPLTGHARAVRSVAFSPDGRILASGGEDSAVRLWDVESRRPLRTLLEKNGNNFVWAVAFAPDGKTLASAGFDNLIRHWDVATGHPIGQPMPGHSGPVTSLAFDPSGQRLVSGSFDNTLRIWPSPGAWADELCAKLTHNMRRSEWHEWVGGDINYAVQCPALTIPEDLDVAAKPESAPAR